MTFFYNPNEKYDGPQIDPTRCDATKCYMTHYENLLFLKVIMGDASTSVVEKAQARKETEICERKMAYWARQHHYDQPRALREMDAAKKRWQGRAG